MDKIKFLDLKYINKKLLNKCKNKIINQLYSGNYILDKNVNSFENNFSKYNHVRFCDTVNSGHDALKITLRALGVKQGDIILVPGMTFISTYFAVSELGAIPKPIDIGLDGVIDSNKLPIKLNKKIKGIIAVNLYGNLCNFKILKKYSNEKKIFLIEDSSQSHGANFKDNSKVKMWGDAATFSFYPGKNLGSIADGGAIITNNLKISNTVKLLRNYGSQKKYYHNIIGYNSRINSTSAIFLNQKLKIINKINSLRKKQEFYYIKNLKSLKQISFLQRNKNVDSSHHIFLILIKNRNKLQKFLDKKKIETIIHYPVAPFLQKPYKRERYKFKKLSTSVRFQNEALSLPLGEHLEKKNLDFIIKKIHEFYKHN